ncbi:MerR family transcriptional regulator [Flagellimonas pacifica]|uniref:Transcriptional regulator, MerR family n=1 Tax=Flagellimonas pacifica TaxID=1247520 RepID=A0A285MU54_9FLAO|nr:MerR family transcriptional regulator [Allomuricauda parva]SNZ00730.1 transcriptional regulator, MerR family [Allomuricauda parva]
MYSVKEVSRSSGVTIRTLHYYDNIGLLKPKERTEAGYRYYGESELLRLQQILFYKELDFSLQKIGQLLDDSEFDLVVALKCHKKSLKKRGEQIKTLLKTIDETIYHLTKEKKIMKPEMLYKGLSKEIGTVYRQEAIREYGKKVIEHAEMELLKLGEADFELLKKNFEKINKELFEMHKTSPSDEKVQQLISSHYQIIRTFWGTVKSKDSQAKAYANLGELYVADERFTMVNGQVQPEYAQFLKEAMQYYAQTQLL